MLKINFKKLKQNYFNIFQNKKYFKKLIQVIFIKTESKDGYSRAIAIFRSKDIRNNKEASREFCLYRFF
jgi:hypothetical protein